MQSHLIFWPVLAQVLLPIIVLLINGKRKKADVKAGTFDPEKAALDNEAWSTPVVLTSKNLANQTQITVLFYVLCIVLASINGVTTFALTVAWLFVISRYLHTYVHITSNYVPLRMNVFIAGVGLVIVLFGLTVRALLAT